MPRSKVPNDPDDLVIPYHLSDRIRHERTQLLVIGLYIIVGGSTASMWLSKLLGF